ncbi:hypothetical protein CDD81_346 [Ophiocordyceps australis]|uniref:Uncharacterized protein n=1 Tax=Ophiocordyceps australis TaxID=1399860 RepID=A0A2C5X8N5_9HYPO|nr:hypothetical protein CDD81_346 [Ophiocordyceps australis]
MRLPFRHDRPTRRPPGPLTSSLLALATLGPSLSNAFSLTPVPSPNLDFSNLGRIGIAGDFNGLSLFEFEQQASKPLSKNGSESLFVRLPNGVYAPIASTDASIRSMCTFRRKNGDVGGVVVAGNFTSFDGSKSAGVALYDPDNDKVTSLEGLEGEVHAVYCDQDRDTVFVGGNFQGANSTNAIAWVGDQGWTNLPFAGFNGPVEAITKASNGHIIFGGNFTGLGNASTPSRRDEQTINISTANITAFNSVPSGDFSDPKNIVCSGGKDGPGQTWLLQDSSPGSWEARFGFGFEPTKLRLWNTHLDGRGTKTFRFLAFPINGIMNLTYVDPETGLNRTCTSECPLSSDPKVEFQDFHFVNRVGMNSFQVAISDWYGSGAGLAGIKLLQDNIFSYAIPQFNEPACGGTKFPSASTSTGPWKQSPSMQSYADYLTVELQRPITSESASVVFFPSIRESGNYSVNMYTPGCRPDGTCDTRGRVNVTGIMSAGTVNANFSTTLFQTNNFDKYDQIYYGYVDKTSDSFKPSVTITPLAGQDVAQLTVVAQRVGFILTNSTGGLNGLYDFNPDNSTVDVSSLDKSAVNKLGSSFDQDSGVTAMVTSDDETFIGGKFSSNDYANIVSIGGPDNDQVNSLQGGLDGQVLGMHLEEAKLYVGGDFTKTKSTATPGLNHVAMYDTKANSWNALGAGVNGRVQDVVPLLVNISSNSTQVAITLTGTFSECNAFGDNKALSVDGFAVWVPSEANWLQNLAGPIPGLSGILTAAVLDLPNDGALFAGALKSSQLGVNGAAMLNQGVLDQFPAKLETGQDDVKVVRRDSLYNESLHGVATGAFYDDDSSNITILAGHFTAQAKGGSSINNLVIIDGSDGNSVSGLGPGVSDDSVFTTLAFRGSVLFAGGKVSGNIQGDQISGLIAYDVKAKSFSNQPAPLGGGQSTVSAISVRRDTAEVYVGGSFEKAGALNCPGVCIYNVDSDQWTQPGNGISGNVYSLMWSSGSMLVAGGDMKANGSSRVYLASYDAKRQSWSAFPRGDEIPGPVLAMTPASSDGNQIWITGKSLQDGSVFLMKYDGDKWQSAKQGLSARSVLRSLQVFTATKSHDKADILDEKQALMLTGSIDLPATGPASAVIYNGTHYQPYLLTTASGSGSGSIAKIFTQKNDFFTSERGHMPLVFVVLIGLAIALGLILLVVLAGLVIDRLRKKREGYSRAPTSMYDRGSGIQRIPPRELLESLGQSRSPAPHL